MRPMSGRERVVDIDVAKLGECADEIGIVLFFARVKARVLQQQHIAILQFGDGFFCHRPDAIGGERHRAAEHDSHGQRDRLQRHRRHRLAARPVEMREQHHARAGIGKLLHRRGLAFDARRIGDLAVLHRNVEVQPHQDSFALYVRQVVKRAVHRVR